MEKPKYLYSIMRHAKHSDMRYIRRVAGETEKYWKCLRDGTGEAFYVRKSNLKERGTNIQYYSVTEEEIADYRKRKALLTRIEKIDARRLSTEQLEQIVTIIGGDKNEKRG